MRVVPVPVRSDNYAYLLIDETTDQAAVVDPYDMTKVDAAAEKEKVTIIANLTTHHHHDHSGGNSKFAAEYPNAPIYGGSTQGQAVKNIVKDGDEVAISEQLQVKCVATPCHTQDSICYYVTDKSKPADAGAVFTGDTLFQGGCGRFFEGNADEMHKALSKLGSLPPETIVFNGHEYTKSNLKFAKSIEPGNPAMERLQNLVDNNAVTTGRSTIADEKEWNVFMRLQSPEILKNIAASSDTTAEQVMNILREKKNRS